ncbi:hypothetical protein BDW60DRAFT_189249 [Aspergillus nidulans var. acristatus]
MVDSFIRVYCAHCRSRACCGLASVSYMVQIMIFVLMRGLGLSRHTGHHRIMELGSPRDDGFRSGVKFFSTHSSESPVQ